MVNSAMFGSEKPKKKKNTKQTKKKRCVKMTAISLKPPTAYTPGSLGNIYSVLDLPVN